MCAFCVLSVTQWHLPCAVVCVWMMAGASVLSIIVIQCELSITCAFFGSILLCIWDLGCACDVWGGSCMARILMSMSCMISVIPYGLYCLAMFSVAMRIFRVSSKGCSLLLVGVWAISLLVSFLEICLCGPNWPVWVGLLWFWCVIICSFSLVMFVYFLAGFGLGYGVYPYFRGVYYGMFKIPVWGYWPVFVWFFF